MKTHVLLHIKLHIKLHIIYTESCKNAYKNIHVHTTYNLYQYINYRKSSGAVIKACDNRAARREFDCRLGKVQSDFHRLGINKMSTKSTKIALERNMDSPALVCQTGPDICCIEHLGPWF